MMINNKRSWNWNLVSFLSHKTPTVITDYDDDLLEISDGADSW